MWGSFQNPHLGCDKLRLGHTDSSAKLIHLLLGTHFRARLTASSQVLEANSRFHNPTCAGRRPPQGHTCVKGFLQTASLIWQVRELWLRDAQKLDQGHRADNGQSWDRDGVCLTPKPLSCPKHLWPHRGPVIQRYDRDWSFHIQDGSLLYESGTKRTVCCFYLLPFASWPHTQCPPTCLAKPPLAFLNDSIL